MQRCCFGGGVAEGALLAERADADTCDGGCDDDTGGVLDCAALSEEGCESIVRVSVPSALRSFEILFTHFCEETKTLFTFRSMTFWNALSGCLSNSSPHVAPAFANRMST